MINPPFHRTNKLGIGGNFLLIVRLRSHPECKKRRSEFLRLLLQLDVLESGSERLRWLGLQLAVMKSLPQRVHNGYFRCGLIERSFGSSFMMDFVQAMVVKHTIPFIDTDQRSYYVALAAAHATFPLYQEGLRTKFEIVQLI